MANGGGVVEEVSWCGCLYRRGTNINSRQKSCICGNDEAERTVYIKNTYEYIFWAGYQ